MRRRPDVLISRRNWRDTREYLDYQRDVRQCDARTVDFSRTALDHLLRWATDVDFARAPDLRPPFPQYLNEFELSSSYRGKLLDVARQFFTWLRDHDPGRFERLRADWIVSLRSKAPPGSVVKRELYSLEDVRALVGVPASSLVAQRDRAMVAMLFLSGMRVGAFATLPVRAVELDHVVEEGAAPIILVRQWPDLGVHTKNAKAANTYLLPQPELADLREIVRAWHQVVLDGVGPRGLWYARIEPGGESFLVDQHPGRYRGDGIARRLRLLCDAAGVAYLSPHKLRHGHIAWARSQCRTIDEFKAVSQNVMHASMQITDTLYSGLPDAVLAALLQNLGIAVDDRRSNDEILDALAEALFKRKTAAE